jgi:predicted permease
MDKLLQLWRRLCFYFRRDQFDRELKEEMRLHLEMKAEENLQAGMSLQESYYAAQRQFGNQTLLQEVSREMWAVRSIETLFQDLHYGVRMLLKHKAFTFVAVLSLALGIGANTAIFSLIDAVLLKLLPVERPEQLYFIHNVGPHRPGGGAPPYPCFERFREQNQSFTELAAFARRDRIIINIDGQREEASGQLVSGNYFSLLGVRPLQGRALSPADDTVPEKGGPDGYVAVISHHYWTRRFGRDPAVIGKVVHFGNDSVTIIGVTPPEFYGLFPGTRIDISLPMMFQGARQLADKDSWWFNAVGRLKPTASVEKAQSELNAIFQSFMDETSTSAEMRRDAFARIELAPASKGLDTLRRQFSRPLQTLMVIVGLVLLIACANVANLLLVRATGRRKEFAVRLALGATRSRLLRQVLTESLLLVSLGGLLGMVVARWGGAFLMSYFDTGRNQLSVNLTLDYRVLLFTAGVSLATGLLFGLIPALQAMRIDPMPVLKDGASTVTRSRSRFGKLLVAAQVALSLLLLVGAGLFLQTLRNLKNLDAGFRRDGVVTMRVNPSVAVYQGTQLANLWKEILARVERLPGVRSPSLSSLSPLDGNDRGVRVEVAGFMPSAERDKDIRLNQVSPGFFQTFGIDLLQGRAFTDGDNESAPKVAILNETAAQFYFGDRSPVGGQLRFKRGSKAEPIPYQVIGVVRDSRYQSLREPDTRLVYLPMQQSLDQLGKLLLAVHGDGRPSDLINGIQSELRAAGNDILVNNIITLNEQVDQSLVQERLVATLSLFFGLLALLLASIGLYGVMSYDVARRTQEIGIRMALGANATRVVRLVLRETLGWVALGAAFGLGAALAVTRWVESLLFGLKANDPLTMVLAALVLLTVAAVAGYLPARRAARIDPLKALRHE